MSCDVYPATVLTDLKGSSGAKRSFSFILNELRLPFFLFLFNWLLDVGFIGKGVALG